MRTAKNRSEKRGVAASVIWITAALVFAMFFSHCNADKEKAAELSKDQSRGTSASDKRKTVKTTRNKAMIKEPITNKLGMKFVYIPPGTFMMGSPEDERRRIKDEILHSVTLTKGFYIQTTVVTQVQWKAVMRSNPSKFVDCGDDCPVEMVTWKDVQEFIKKLNQKESTDLYRLPTEAEWEYACRAGSSTRYYFGDDERRLSEYAWYEKNSGRTTHPVGQLKPNAWGLYDMHGNVWEWCQDWYGRYPSDDVTDPVPVGSEFDDNKINRGGSWLSHDGGCRSAFRDHIRPKKRHDGLGLRLVRSAE